MAKYKKLINEINSKSGNFEIKISDYFQLLGYSDKHTFYRFLKNNQYEVSFKNEKINRRIGKEFYMHKSDLLNLLNMHLSSDKAWILDYTNFLYIQYRIKIYKFKETIKLTERPNLGNYMKAKGLFYDYSLSTLNFCKEIPICEYQCYKLCNTKYELRNSAKRLDYSTSIPYACFDSKEHNIRIEFIQFIDFICKELNVSNHLLIQINAYKMAVQDLLNRQFEIDNVEIQAQQSFDIQKEEDLKNIYRKACKLFHPDTNKNPEAEEIMKQINMFYENKNTHGITDILEKVKKTV